MKHGHGCGHNLLGVGSLMGAVGIKHYLETEGRPGTVVFFGCPAEEGGTGKSFMVRDGCFNDLDASFCWHPADYNTMPPGPFLANYIVRYSFPANHPTRPRHRKPEGALRTRWN